MSVVFSRIHWIIFTGLSLLLVLFFSAFSTLSTSAAACQPVQISSDPYTNSTSQHQTQVEPDSYSHGSTIVVATQVGRFNDGGSSNIGWSTLIFP